MQKYKTVALREIAHSRSGEKGNSSTVSVIAYEMEDYDLLVRHVTVDAVRDVFGAITKGGIRRYEAPLIGAVNFVLDEVLEGGRSRTLAFEESGKALSSLMLAVQVDVPADYLTRADRLKGPATPAGMASNTQTWTAADGRRVRLGSASGWSRDRFEPAMDLATMANVQYLCFDSMSEVTMSAAQVARIEDGSVPPFDPYLRARLEPLLKVCKQRGVRIVTNQGWLDPVAAAHEIVSMARAQGIVGLKVAAVSGAMLTDRIAEMGVSFIEDGEPVAQRKEHIVSAEAYLGSQGIVQALDGGADVVITTRIADACLYLGPLAHEFAWQLDDPAAMGRGMAIGHLMECGAQLSGGYFAEPGYKEVPGLEELGNPIVEVSASRQVLSKLPNSGGLLSEATCKEQLLYEVQDPSCYFGPDCITDFTQVRFEQIGRDEVEFHVGPAIGREPTRTLKALVGLREGYMTEEMVIFAGAGALGRARMTQKLLEARFRKIDLRVDELRFDYLGVNAVHRESSPPADVEPYEVVLRIALKASDRHEADKLRREVDPLAVNGVTATGKWATSAPGSRVRPVVGLSSCLVPREWVPVRVDILQS